MGSSQQKTLILSLARRNSQPLYALNIAGKLPKERYDLLTSKQSTYACNMFKNCFSIHTYINTWTFLFSSIFLLPLQFLMLLPQLIRNYDRLYLPYGHFWDLPFILLFKIQGKSVIYTVHDGILHHGERHKVVQYLEDCRINRADHLIFLTRFVEQEIKNQFRSSVPTSVIPHGALVGHFDFPTKLRTDETCILFFGRISKYKGVELLIEAFEELQLPQTRLIIAGEPIYAFKAKEHKAIDYHLEYLSETKIATLLKTADILVLPYLEATQSGVVSLGISAGLPMICSRVGGLPEQLEDDECIWVKPNKKELKVALKTLATDLELQEKLREKMSLKNQDLSKNQWAELKHLILGRTIPS